MARQPSQRGAVLLVVLLLVALLASFMAEFAFSTLVETRLTETFRDGTKAYYLAKGGVRAALAILQDDRNGYDALTEFWAQGIADYPVGEGGVSIAIRDLGGKIDVNRLVTPEGNVDVVTKDRLIRLFGLMDQPDPEGLVDALTDWIDADDDVAPLGAETPFYQTQERPYRCKNAPLDELDEIALVRGFDRELAQRIKDHLAVDGDAKINVNTATVEVLAALAEEMTLDDARYISDLRKRKPFSKVEELKDQPGFETLYWAINTHLGVTSSRYAVISRAEVNSGRRTAEAILDKSGGRVLYFKVY